MKKRDITVAICTAAIMCVPMAIIAHQQQVKANMPSTAFNWDSVKVVATKVGEKRQFFDAPTSTLDNLECHVTTLNPGELAHAPHQHPEEELTIVKEGTLEVLVNGELKIVGPGSVVFQSANMLHSIKNVGTTKAVYHAIKWKSNKTIK
jgi:quercetin dioxygenase-like cupin family protein